jgi:predicted nucleic acid-binding protein
MLAAASGAGAKTLYSEDMQNGFKLGALTVVNPFA